MLRNLIGLPPVSSHAESRSVIEEIGNSNIEKYSINFELSR